MLVRTEDRSSRARLEAQYDLSEGVADQLVFGSDVARLATIGQADAEQVWAHIAQTLSLSPDELHRFKEQFWAGDCLDREVVAYLASLRPVFQTALLSNAWTGVRQEYARRFGLVENVTVDKILYSSELGVAKPDVKIYKILSDTLAIPYHEILFVDDFIENIHAAQTLGIQVIHFRTGMNLINQIKSRLSQNNKIHG